MEDQEERWVQDLKKAAGSRKIIKKNGRSRLDPEDSSGTLDLLLKTTNSGEEENEKADEENDLLKTKNFGEENETTEDVKNKVTTIPEEELLTPEDQHRERFDAENNQRCIMRLSKPLQNLPGLTYAQVRERFHRKMEELRSTRPSLTPPLDAAEDQVQPGSPYSELRVINRMKKRREREMVAAELRELNRMKKRLRSTRTLPPPLAAVAEDQVQQSRTRMLFPRYPYVEPNRMKRRLAKLKREINRMKKRLVAKGKQEMGAAGVKKQDAVMAETLSEAVKIGEEEVINVAGKIQVKNRKIEKKKKSSCT